MAERRRGQEVGAIGECRAEERREEPIADREVLGEVVVERDLVGGVVPHGVVLAVVLLGLGVDADEAVHWCAAARGVGVGEVGLAVHAGPAVIEVGLDAAVGVVEREHRAAAGVDVAIAAVQGAGGVGGAAQAVDTAMVVAAAAGAAISVAVVPVIAGARRVVRRARGIGQHAEVVVERVVLLHDDDDVLDV